MTKGFYNLTSGILSQTRRLDVIGNNMTNLSTPGYKAETYTDRTFEEVLISQFFCVMWIDIAEVVPA